VRSALYREDLAWIHHADFGDFARSAGPEVLNILRRAGIKRGKLVDLGCGSGIWAAMAERAGFRVIGVDFSRAMLALARRESPKSKFVQASLDQFSFPPCDVVTALGEPFNYGAGGQASRLRPLFARVARALSPNGRLIFDVLLYDGQPMNYRTWRAGQDYAVLTEVSEDRKKRKLTRRMLTFRTVNGRIRRGDECHVLECFPRVSVERALRAAGFKFRSSRRYGKWPLLPRRLAFIATKPPGTSQF
jgi:SAM-dependent methyltransferase